MAGNANSGGRNKLSTQAHIVKGTFQPCRHGDHSAPEPPKGRPELPEPLEGRGLAEWERMVARLEQSGTLSRVDDAAIYQYARLYAETEQIAEDREHLEAAIQRLEENLGDFEGEDFIRLAQEITQQRKLAAKCTDQMRSGRMGIRQWLVEFGMTPAARSRVKLPPQKPQSKVDQFRNAKAGA